MRVYSDPPRQHQIDTVEEILEANLPFGGLDLYRSFYNESDDVFLYQIFQNYQTNPNKTLREYLEQISIYQSSATMANGFYVEYYIARGDKAVCTETECPAIFAIPMPVLCYNINFVARKGFPYIYRMNDLILRFRENGVLDKWLNDMKHKNALKGAGKSKKKGINALSLMHLEGAFVVLLIGIIIGISSLGMELLVKNQSGKEELKEEKGNYKKKLPKKVLYKKDSTPKKFAFIN